MDMYNLVQNVKICCLKAEKFPEGVSAAYDKLVNQVGAADQRTFYGISYMEKDGSITYRAGATEVAEDEGATGFGIFHNTERKVLNRNNNELEEKD